MIADLEKKIYKELIKKTRAGKVKWTRAGNIIYWGETNSMTYSLVTSKNSLIVKAAGGEREFSCPNKELLDFLKDYFNNIVDERTVLEAALTGLA